MIEQIIIFFQIVLIDLVLAGDNAIIIGMVASQFKDEIRKKIIFWGIAAAIILRILFTLITATASNCPLTGNDSYTKLTCFNLAAISFFGDLTNTIAFTILNQLPSPSRFQY